MKYGRDPETVPSGDGAFRCSMNVSHVTTDAVGEYITRLADDVVDAHQTAEELYLEGRDILLERGHDPAYSPGVAIYGPDRYYAYYSEADWRQKVEEARHHIMGIEDGRDGIVSMGMASLPDGLRGAYLAGVAEGKAERERG